ncbi:MAG: hypothetical protein AMXMBFR16_03900 [Candidatus Uhrbacteria bacterium]
MDMLFLILFVGLVITVLTVTDVRNDKKRAFDSLPFTEQQKLLSLAAIRGEKRRRIH